MLAPSFKSLSALGLLLVGASAHAASASKSGWKTWFLRTHDVRTYGAACDGTTNDTAAIFAALSALSPGDTLVFPASSTCVIDRGLTVSNLSHVTIEGRGATLLGESTMCPGEHMLKFRFSTDLVIRDLTIDANASAREAWSIATGGPARDAIGGTSSSLMFYGVEGLEMLDVEVLDSWHDSVYFGKGVGVDNRDVWVERLRTSGAGRNNLTLIDCTDCMFLDNILADATAGNFDIEPYDTSHVVENVVLANSVVQAAGAQCVHATNSSPGSSQISGITIADNTISDCHLKGEGGYGAGVVLVDVEDVVIDSNAFEDISLYGSGSSSDSRSVIDFFLARNVEVRNNHFDRIHYDPANSSVFYFWNDAMGYQATHWVYSNELYTIPSTSGWCWVANTSPVKADVQRRVFDNIIVTGLQSPNPGCY